MRNFKKGIICAGFILLLSTSVWAETISIVADEWYPYNGAPNSSYPGYGIEIASRIFRAAGFKVTYSIVPWKRAIADTRKGKYTAILGAFKEDAPDFYFPKEEFGQCQNCFFVKKENSWRYTGLNSLLLQRIGLIQDYSYGKELDDFFKRNPKITDFAFGGDPLALNIKKLLTGRFQVLVEDQNVFSAKAKALGVSEKIIKAGKARKIENVYIAFSPKNPKSKEYAAIYTEGIRKLKKSGELDKILARYGLSYWK